MNTNQFFNTRRFCKLIYNDLLINYKQYILTIIGAFILGLVIIYLNIPRAHYGEFRHIFDASKYTQLFIMFLFGLGVFVGTAFPSLNSKVNISGYLLIPASTFEKFLSQFLIRIVAGLSLFLVIFWLDAHIARLISISQMIDYETKLHCADGAKIIDKFNFKMLFINFTDKNDSIHYLDMTGIMACIFTTINIGLYLFSVKLCFRKLALVKTLISFAVVIYCFVISWAIFMHIFYPETIGFRINMSGYELSNGINIISMWMMIMLYAAPVFLLPFGYFKLKEKQV